MIEMTWVADALKIGNFLITLVYYGAAALLIYAVIKWRTPLWSKTVAVSVVVAAFAYLPVSGYLKYRDKQAYSRTAWDRFNKYCAEKAGEKIYIKVEDAESVFVLRPRTDVSNADLADQSWRGDPYGHAYTKKETELTNLLETHRYEKSKFGPVRGFDFLEARQVDELGKETIFEYRIGPSGFDLLSRQIAERRSRYGFTWEDVSSDEDRKYWISGSHLKVVDLQTNETVAERVGYMIDAGFGDRRNGRTPWLLALNNSCPKIDVHPPRFHTRQFLLKALRPALSRS